VIGTCRRPEHAEHVRALGAKAVALDILDPRAVRQAVFEAEPEAVIHQASALTNARFGRSLDRTFAPTNRLRTDGTDNLLAAAKEAGVHRFLAQSFASFRYIREGGMIKSEDDPLDNEPPKTSRETHAAMSHLDKAVLDAGGIALRYGGFYGGPNDGLVEPVRKRRIPIVGDGAAFTSFIHLHDAAAATVLALAHHGPGIYNIVDDEPAPARDWLPVMANALGAKPPRHVTAWLARLIAGEGAVMTTRGASNAKAKRELDWTLVYPNWRQGFHAAYAATVPTETQHARPGSTRSPTSS
jgi:nucleoside-diphosphate-sugar epimerase